MRGFALQNFTDNDMPRITWSKALIAFAFSGCLANTGHALSAETLGAKLRRLAADAAASNSLQNPPLLPAPKWIPNHAYSPGEVVQSGTHLYTCYKAGTSATAFGPMETGYAPITDASAQWLFSGSPTVTMPDPAAPVVTTTVSMSTVTAAGVTKFYTPFGSPSSFAFGGGRPTAAPPATMQQAAFPAVQAYASKTGGNTGLNNGTNNYYWTATFVTDSPKVAIGLNYPAPATIVIDGRKLYPGALKGASGGNPTGILLDFANAGGRKKRTITIEVSGNAYFAGVGIDSASTLSAPDTTDRIRVAFFGSSIEAGGASYPVLGGFSWPIQVSKLLGWSDPWNLGIGGTGYIANLGGQSYSYIWHAGDAIDIAPDIVVVGGPVNDGGSGTLMDLKSAAVQLFQKLRASLPKAIIIGMGTFPGSSGPSTDKMNRETTITNAVDQLNDSRVFFIPVSTGPQGSIITGTGTITAPNGKGNSDLYITADGTHPSQLGIDYEAIQYASRIKSMVVDMLP